MLINLTMLFFVATATSTRDFCPFVRYTGSYEDVDHVEDHALVGFSYKNVTVTSEEECFSECITDCRCLSYQVFGTRCEVMDEDRQIVPAAKFVSAAGYVYFGLKQKFKYESTIGSCGGVCRNGCCRLVSCLNGGKCREKCDDVKRKFECNCTSEYEGRLCEIKKITSCKDHAKLPGAQSGIYPIMLSTGQELKVYCDLTSQSGYAWTLIESFAYEKYLQFQEKPFPVDYPVYQSSPQWKEYRLSHNHMLDIKSHATLWRATCKYDTDGLQKRDSVTGLLNQTDIFELTDGSVCRRVQYINIRGMFCSNCSTHFIQIKGRHAYVDSYFGTVLNCDWNASPGSIYAETQYGYSWDDNFGFYMISNPAHRCTSSSSSTTQWWLGTRV